MRTENSLSVNQVTPPLCAQLVQLQEGRKMILNNLWRKGEGRMEGREGQREPLVREEKLNYFFMTVTWLISGS